MGDIETASFRSGSDAGTLADSTASASLVSAGEEVAGVTFGPLDDRSNNGM